MTPKEKAIELRSQFGENAKYVCLEILDTLKAMYKVSGLQFTIALKSKYDFWQEVKQELDNLKN